jgi:DNA-binding winged helix-turn-helix (wHTH) protein
LLREEGPFMAIFRFGDFQADDLKFELRRLGKPIHVQRVVLETLFCLLRRQGCVVSRSELVQGPWRGAKVSAAAVSRAVMLARRAIGDERASTIVTVHGLGYRFVADVSSVAEEPMPSSSERAVAVVEDEPSSVGLAGRGAELAALHRYLGRARGSHGRVVLVTGSMGIGKTALVTRFAYELEHKGPLVAWGRAWEASVTPVLWPWLEVVRSTLHGLEQAGEGEVTPTQREERARLLASLERAVAVRTADAGPDEHFFMFDAVTRFLKHSARQRALVVILEDINHADPASILLLEFLRQRIGELPLLVVATRRPVHGEHPRSLLEEAGAHVKQLPLFGLGTTDVAQMLEALGRPSTEQLASAVRDLTDGNPLLIRELAASPALAAVQAGSDRWIEQWLLPDRIARALRARLLELPAETQRALTVAAVSGARFHGAMIAELSATEDHANSLRALEPALARQLIQADLEHPGEYRLTCLLLRELICRELSHVERSRLQRHVREWRARSANLAALEKASKLQSSPFSAASPIEARGS